MTGKKKKVDFSVRPRTAKENLPPDADQWVRGGQGAEAAPAKAEVETEPQKRLTLNLPADLHKAFKMRCTAIDVTIQERVRKLIEGDLAAGAEGTKAL
jgi:hypothetical protein